MQDKRQDKSIQLIDASSGILIATGLSLYD